MKPPCYNGDETLHGDITKLALFVAGVLFAIFGIAGCYTLDASEPIKHVGPAECYPDPAKTPGCIMPQATEEAVSQPGYSKTVRHVSNLLKWQVFILYGFAAPGEAMDLKRLHELERQFEIDHFISLELGGSNDIKNLWPEPYAAPVMESQTLGARQKDVVETELHRRIKKGQLTLTDAQRIILTDWVRAYFEIKSGKPLTIPSS